MMLWSKGENPNEKDKGSSQWIIRKKMRDSRGGLTWPLPCNSFSWHKIERTWNEGRGEGERKPLNDQSWLLLTAGPWWPTFICHLRQKRREIRRNEMPHESWDTRLTLVSDTRANLSWMASHEKKSPLHTKMTVLCFFWASILNILPSSKEPHSAKWSVLFLLLMTWSSWFLSNLPWESQ